jgi:dolichol kinase
MNKIIYNLLLVIIGILLLFSISYITRFIILTLKLPTVRYKESFVVPKIIKEHYRPIERNIRMTYEGFYDKTSTDISNLFRKFGII